MRRKSAGISKTHTCKFLLFDLEKGYTNQKVVSISTIFAVIYRIFSSLVRMVIFSKFEHFFVL